GGCLPRPVRRASGAWTRSASGRGSRVRHPRGGAMKGSGRSLVGLVVAGTVLALAGGAVASIPDASGVIHGCYNKSSGSLRIIDSSVTGCSSKETALTWNQVGPRGLQGVPGLVWGGAWTSGVVYSPDDAVTYLGSSYKAIYQNSNDQPPSANWLL